MSRQSIANTTTATTPPTTAWSTLRIAPSSPARESVETRRGVRTRRSPRRAPRALAAAALGAGRAARALSGGEGQSAATWPRSWGRGSAPRRADRAARRAFSATSSSTTTTQAGGSREGAGAVGGTRFRPFPQNARHVRPPRGTAKGRAVGECHSLALGNISPSAQRAPRPDLPSPARCGRRQPPSPPAAPRYLLPHSPCCPARSRRPKARNSQPALQTLLQSRRRAITVQCLQPPRFIYLTPRHAISLLF